MVEAERAKGAPVLLLDAGNALFSEPSVGGRAGSARRRAELLLAEMDALGTAAMAVGPRDLALGPEPLRAPRAHLRPLSVNLVDAAGARLFAPSSVVEVGGVRVGLLGVSPAGPVAAAPGVRGLAPLPAALAEARRLRREERAEVVVVLAALPHAQALALAQEAERSVDFVLQSGEAREAGTPTRAGSAVVASGADRGRQLVRLQLQLPPAAPPGVPPARRGPFADGAEAERAREALAGVERSLAEAEARLARATEPALRRELEATRDAFRARRSVLQQAARGGDVGTGRAFRLEVLNLGPEVPGDPALAGRVRSVETPGALAH